MGIAIRYTIFALFATIVNIASQDICLRIYAGIYAMLVSVLVGTAAGLVVKYVLDKRYIFQYQVKSVAHDTRIFALYASTGLITTGIFWGFEFGFDALFHSLPLRYLGGVIGLAIGYYVKYRLDRKYVFLASP